MTNRRAPLFSTICVSMLSSDIRLLTIPKGDNTVSGASTAQVQSRRTLSVTRNVNRRISESASFVRDIHTSRPLLLFFLRGEDPPLEATIQNSALDEYLRGILINIYEFKTRNYAGKEAPLHNARMRATACDLLSARYSFSPSRCRMSNLCTYANFQMHYRFEGPIREILSVVLYEHEKRMYVYKNIFYQSTTVRSEH